MEKKFYPLMRRTARTVFLLFLLLSSAQQMRGGEFYYVYTTSTTGTVSANTEAPAIGIFVNDVTKKTLTVSSSIFSNGTLGTITIPSEITIPTGGITTKSTTNSSGTETLIAGTKYSVTAIAPAAFKGKQYSVSITIPNSVTTIGSDAFANSPKLTTVTFQGDAGTVTSAMFLGCTALTTLNFNAGVTIGETAFKSNTKLSTLSFGSGTTSIGASAFSGCTGITSVTFGTGTTIIGNSAFSGCTGIGNLAFGANLTSIGDYAFKGCTGVTAITFAGTGLTSLGKSAFTGCNNTSLTSIDMSQQTQLTSIPEAAFQSAHVTSFNFPPNITLIDNSAFRECYLTSISIPSTVRRIGELAFYTNAGLGTITLSDANALVSVGEYAFNGTSWLTNQKKSTTNGMIYLGNVALIYNGTAPVAISGTAGLEKSTVVGVAGGCFRGKTNITSVTIPSTVKNIDENAFYGCTGLKTATLSADLTSMGQDVFTGCTALTDVYVKNTTAPTTAANTFLTTSTNTSTTVYIPESDDIAVTEYGDATKGHKAAYHTDFWITNTKGLKYYHDGLNTALKYFESTKGSQKAFSTLYVNFPYELPTTDMKAYTVSEDNASSVVMTEITGSPVVIPSQTPVLLVSDAAASGLIVKETTNTVSAIGSNKLSGTLTGTTKEAVENGTTNKLYTFGVGSTSGIVGFYAFNGTTIPAHKAYLLSSTGTQSKAFTFDGGLTGIKTIFSASIDKETPFYELSGKIATQLERGNIYIKNGKKIIY